MRVDRGRKGGPRGTAVADNLVIGLLVLVTVAPYPLRGSGLVRPVPRSCPSRGPLRSPWSATP